MGAVGRQERRIDRQLGQVIKVQRGDGEPPARAQFLADEAKQSRAGGDIDLDLRGNGAVFHLVPSAALVAVSLRRFACRMGKFTEFNCLRPICLPPARLSAQSSGMTALGPSAILRAIRADTGRPWGMHSHI